MKNQRIMVALQEVEHVDSLVRLACKMAEGTQSEVVALHIVEVGPGLPLDADADILDHPGKELLAQAHQFAKNQFSKDILTRLVRGREPGPAIVRQAEDQSAEVLILGYRRKKSHMAKALMGSTVEYVIEHAPCRVIVEAVPARLRNGVSLASRSQSCSCH